MTKTHRRKSHDDRPGPPPTAADLEQMDALGINRAGEAYGYRGHRYNRLDEAVRHAQALQASAQAGDTQAAPPLAALLQARP